MKQKIQILLVWQTFDRFKAWFSGINSINRQKKKKCRVECFLWFLFIRLVVLAHDDGRFDENPIVKIWYNFEIRLLLTEPNSPWESLDLRNTRAYMCVQNTYMWTTCSGDEGIQCGDINTCPYIIYTAVKNNPTKAQHTERGGAFVRN